MQEPTDAFLTGKPRGKLRAADTAPQRLERVLRTIVPSGAITLLLGDPGVGKSYLAEHAALELAAQLGRDVEVFRLPQPPHPSSGVMSAFAANFPAAFSTFVEVTSPGSLEPSPQLGAPDLARLILSEMATLAAGRDRVLVAPDLDDYAPRDLYILEHLAQDPELRIVATARRHSAAAERIGRGPRAQNVSIGPMDLEESAQFVSRLLGVDQIETETLRRWHTRARGNTYALSLLARASDQSGALHRSRGIAWAAEDNDDVPGEYADLVVAACTPEEIAVLEIIALAEPVVEPALLRSLHPGALSSLFERELLRTPSRPGGGTLLMISHPLLAASLRSGMSPVRRVMLNDQIYRTLQEDLGGLDPVYIPERLIRLVVFGLEAGQPLPLPWLWATFELMVRGGDPRLVMRLSLAVASHTDADGPQAGAAALLGSRIATSIGDQPSLRSAFGIMQVLIDDSERAASISVFLRGAMQLALIRQMVWDDAPVEEIEVEYARVASEGPSDDQAFAEQVRTALVVSLAYCGRLQDAALHCPAPNPSDDLKVEWIRSPARAIAALILEQQGALSLAISSAENARRLSQLGTRARADYVDFQGFCWLMGHWVGGSTEAARQVLAELESSQSPTSHTEAYYSGLIEAGVVLLALQEGRWREAAQGAERLLDRLAKRDSYGLAPLIQAAFAHALAVLGEHDAAIRAIRASDVMQRGIGQALIGHRRVLTLRARQWLRVGDIRGTAQALAAWAREENLALIELQSLHAEAFEVRKAMPELVERAREIAGAVDPPLGSALLAHIERLATPIGSAAAASDEPEVRLLAELGTWLPLPPAPGLTAREREIVMLAALGHTSRFISERLHISTRTVETHLSNVFAKLGLENRDELWRWAARERSLPRP